MFLFSLITVGVIESQTLKIKRKDSSSLCSVALTTVVPIIAVNVTFLAHIGFGYDLTPAEVRFLTLIRDLR